MKDNTTISKITLIISVLFFLFSTYSVKAYELLGCSWDNASDLITFFIDNNDDDIETALGLWNYADCPNVSFKAGGFPFSHNVGVAWVDYNWVGWDGLCINNKLIWNPSIIVKSSIKINTYYTDTYSTNARLSVITHELGHSLGLGHEIGAVLMNDSTFGDESRFGTYGIYEPQEDDEDGVNYLY